MKISKIKFENHYSLNNFELTLDPKTGISIHYLIGNNGSGKTRLLESIYTALTGSSLDSGEYKHTTYFQNSTIDDINYIDNENLKKAANPVSLNSLHYESFSSASYRRALIINTSTAPGRTHSIPLATEALCPIVYSEVEINFDHSAVTNVTTSNTDDEKPAEKSTNLNVIIPQMLIDIRSQDNEKIAKKYEDQGSLSGRDKKTLDLKFDRFVNTYNKVMGGSKTFHEILPSEDGFIIQFKDRSGKIIDISQLSSGEKQVIYRFGFILKNLDTLKKSVILIDEPEISLHPLWQMNFMKILTNLFKNTDTQIIIATHSPYIFKNYNPRNEECILIDRLTPKSKNISLSLNNQPYSTNFISYKAFGVYNETLHAELYSLLMIKSKTKSVNGFNNWLEKQATGLAKVNRSKKGNPKFNNGKNTAKETLPVWIRNKLSHPEVDDRRDYSRPQLEKSIKAMVLLLDL